MRSECLIFEMPTSKMLGHFGNCKIMYDSRVLTYTGTYVYVHMCVYRYMWLIVNGWVEVWILQFYSFDIRNINFVPLFETNSPGYHLLWSFKCVYVMYCTWKQRKQVHSAWYGWALSIAPDMIALNVTRSLITFKIQTLLLILKFVSFKVLSTGIRNWLRQTSF